MAEVALQYNDSYNEVIVSFANNVHTPEGGMHEEGFKRALTNVLNAYGKKIGVLKTMTKSPATTAGRVSPASFLSSSPTPSSRDRPRPNWATARSAPW